MHSLAAFETLLLRRREVAHLAGIGFSSVPIMVKRGALPPPIKLGRSVRWNRAELVSFLTRKHKKT